jgi:aspartate 1-decarboxylase
MLGFSSKKSLSIRSAAAHFVQPGDSIRIISVDAAEIPIEMNKSSNIDRSKAIRRFGPDPLEIYLIKGN